MKYINCYEFLSMSYVQTLGLIVSFIQKFISPFILKNEFNGVNHRFKSALHHSRCYSSIIL